MNVILILLGLGAFYLLYEKQQQEISLIGQSGTPVSGPGASPFQTGINVAPLPGSSGGGFSGLAIGQQAAQAGVQAGESFAQNAADEGSAIAGSIGQALPFVGAAIAPIFQMLAAHSARVKGAQTENQLLSEIQPAVQQDITSIIAARNSRQITDSQAFTALTQVQENYWNAVAGVEHSAGQAGGPQDCLQYNPPQKPVGYNQYVLAGTLDYWHANACNNSCTASCCVGCSNIMNWLASAHAAIQNGRPTTIYFRGIVGSHYGNPGMNAWTLKYTP